MTDEQKAAYVVAMAACVSARTAAMRAANYDATAAKGGKLKYSEKDFDDLIVEYGIHHNGVIGLFHD